MREDKNLYFNAKNEVITYICMYIGTQLLYVHMYICTCFNIYVHTTL